MAAYEFRDILLINETFHQHVDKYGISLVHSKLKKPNDDEYGIVALTDGSAFKKERCRQDDVHLTMHSDTHNQTVSI
jgi:hypothetical protein